MKYKVLVLYVLYLISIPLVYIISNESLIGAIIIVPAWMGFFAWLLWRALKAEEWRL